MELKVNWKLEEEISKHVGEPTKTISQVVKLLEQDNTVPFISRYRQEMTNGMSAEKIRSIKEKMEELNKLEKKALSAVKMVMKSEGGNPMLEKSILCCMDEDVISEMVAPFKACKKPSKLQEAHSFNLQDHVSDLLAGKSVNVTSLVDAKIEALSSKEGVRGVLVLLTAEVVSNQPRWLTFLMQQCETARDVFVTSKQVKSKKISENVDISTFNEYFDFKAPFHSIKPYKYLAIQRGKGLGVLKSEIEVPDRVKKALLAELNKCHYSYNKSSDHHQLLADAFEMAYEQFLHKRLLCLLRRHLWRKAEEAAIGSFSRNLGQLLLEQPVRDRVIMGVDPGFTNGCKYAVIDEKGEVLLTGKAFISNRSCNDTEVSKIREALLSTKCELVAIGDGCGSRQTEEFFDHHIRKGTFKPLNVLFCISREAGASVYSASPLATQELPQLDVTLRGAVSIARRTQDPLVELIKIEPKNLGVGMYQHDLTDSKLRTALDGVVEDCVSFVGVDLNVCGEHILQHVAGIGASLAKKIIAKRVELGRFESRQQLMQVRGMGAKTFTQCAGFLRVLRGAGVVKAVKKEEVPPSLPLSSLASKTSGKRAIRNRGSGGDDDDVVVAKKSKRTNKETEANTLDRTSVHPEAYTLADKLILRAGLHKEQIGEEAFVQGISKFRLKIDTGTLAKELESSEERIDQVLESLSQVTDFDIRSAFGKPLMRSGVQWLSDLRVGSRLIGKVTNLTDFGAFVDVGVERDGLIHISNLPSSSSSLSSSRRASGGYGGAGGLRLGDVVDVVVTNVDKAKGRIGLALRGGKS